MKKVLMAILLFIFQNSFAAKNTIIDGLYDMKITIGKNIFHDVFLLEGEKSPIDMSFYYGNIKGSITVPNQFTSPLSGSADCGGWTATCKLNFDIIANENGQTFNVHYKARIDIQDYFYSQTISGSASLDNGQLLGNFIASKRK